MTRFSESGKVEGPWTGDTTVYKAGNGTYSGHAYPLFLSDDASTVVLSWSDKITGIPGMATLKFS